MAAKKTKRFSDYLPHPFSFNPSGHAVSLFLMGNLSSITCGFCEHTCMTTHKCPVGGGERSVGGGGGLNFRLCMNFTPSSWPYLVVASCLVSFFFVLFLQNIIQYEFSLFTWLLYTLQILSPCSSFFYLPKTSCSLYPFPPPPRLPVPSPLTQEVVTSNACCFPESDLQTICISSLKVTTQSQIRSQELKIQTHTVVNCCPVITC